MEYTTILTIKIETDDSEDTGDFIEALQTLMRLMTNETRTVEIKSVEDVSN